MEIIDKKIDGGKAFDWGKTSSDYAKYRDIYPQDFYDKIVSRKLCIKGQNVLDIGTGTGVIPRNMYRYGAKWIGTDISEKQIEQAKILSKDMDIEYYAYSAEDLVFSDNTFDVITACQCFWYFDHDIIMPKLHRLLKENGRILVLYMAWLPFDDKIAGMSENLVLKYNPDWTGCKETRHEIFIPNVYDKYFKRIHNEIFDVKISFTRESWNGRIKACRGIGASLSEDKVAEFEKEHKEMLSKIAPDEFDILHYCAISVIEKI